MKVEIFLDRGNGSSKVLSIIEGDLQPPFKIPSVTREVREFNNGIKLLKNDSVFLCGTSAIESYDGIRYTPLDQNDKIRELSVVVAAAISQIVPGGGPIELSLCVSSPIYHKGIEGDIIKELSKLSSGVRCGDRQYSILIERVGAFQEGVIFLELNDEFNGVVDLGQGTLLAGVRYPNRGVLPLSLSDGNLGGCNLILTALLLDTRFLKAVKAAGFPSAPSPDKLSSLLSEGHWEVKGIDFRKFLKPHMTIAKQRLENAAQSVRAELNNASPYDTILPRIAFVGGGSSLFQGVLGNLLEKWCEKHGFVLVTQSPDYQTVLQMHELANIHPERLITVPATAAAA
ncbi:MAG: hypothetical protein WBA76_11495 [Phormidesmis sp.]